MSSNIWLVILGIFVVVILINYVFLSLVIILENHQLKNILLLSLIPLSPLALAAYNVTYWVSESLAKSIGKRRLGKPVITVLEWQVVSLSSSRDFRLGFKFYWKTILANPNKVAAEIDKHREKLDESKNWRG